MVVERAGTLVLERYWFGFRDGHLFCDPVNLHNLSFGIGFVVCKWRQDYPPCPATENGYDHCEQCLTPNSHLILFLAFYWLGYTTSLACLPWSLFLGGYISICTDQNTFWRFSQLSPVHSILLPLFGGWSFKISSFQLIGLVWICQLGYRPCSM